MKAGETSVTYISLNVPTITLVLKSGLPGQNLIVHLRKPHFIFSKQLGLK
jgi:hypothetical protein